MVLGDATAKFNVLRVYSLAVPILCIIALGLIIGYNDDLEDFAQAANSNVSLCDTDGGGGRHAEFIKGRDLLVSEGSDLTYLNRLECRNMWPLSNDVSKHGGKNFTCLIDAQREKLEHSVIDMYGDGDRKRRDHQIEDWRTEKKTLDALVATMSSRAVLEVFEKQFGITTVDDWLDYFERTNGQELPQPVQDFQNILNTFALSGGSAPRNFQIVGSSEIIDANCLTERCYFYEYGDTSNEHPLSGLNDYVKPMTTHTYLWSALGIGFFAIGFALCAYRVAINAETDTANVRHKWMKRTEQGVVVIGFVCFVVAAIFWMQQVAVVSSITCTGFDMAANQTLRDAELKLTVLGTIATPSDGDNDPGSLENTLANLQGHFVSNDGYTGGRHAGLGREFHFDRPGTPLGDSTDKMKHEGTWVIVMMGVLTALAQGTIYFLVSTHTAKDGVKKKNYALAFEHMVLMLIQIGIVTTIVLQCVYVGLMEKYGDDGSYVPASCHDTAALGYAHGLHDGWEDAQTIFYVASGVLCAVIFMTVVMQFALQDIEKEYNAVAIAGNALGVLLLVSMVTVKTWWIATFHSDIITHHLQSPACGSFSTTSDDDAEESHWSAYVMAFYVCFVVEVVLSIIAVYISPFTAGTADRSHFGKSEGTFAVLSY